MNHGIRAPEVRRARVALALAIALGLTTAVLVYVGSLSAIEWRRSAQESMEQRVDEVLALTIAALRHDMKGAQLSVLVPLTPEALRPEPPFDLADVVARAFARFPYPESFFAWKSAPGGHGMTYAFNRADRPAAWDAHPQRDDPYPVVTIRDPAPLRSLIATGLVHAAPRTSFAVFEWRHAETVYQIVVQFFHGGSNDDRLLGMIGFTVNLTWVRREYFADILRQVSRIGPRPPGLALAILDGDRRVVESVGEELPFAPVRDRTFPLVFYDVTLLPAPPRNGPPVEQWLARVSGSDRAFTVAGAAAGRSLGVLALVAMMATVGLVLTVRAVRAAAEMAAVKGEFVAAVSHELKTPLARIRLVGDTLAQGRYDSTTDVAEYAHLLSRESDRLSRLIDNLLTYARVSDTGSVYRFEPVPVTDLVDAALERYDRPLAEARFEVDVRIPAGLPRVTADRATLIQALDNLIDNTIKYSDAERSLSIVARADGDRVRIAVSDRGVGIPRNEIAHVCEQFFRGASKDNDTRSSSGLGLAIVRRIVDAHRGELTVRSEEGRGTTVEIALPVARTV